MYSINKYAHMDLYDFHYDPDNILFFSTKKIEDFGDLKT